MNGNTGTLSGAVLGVVTATVSLAIAFGWHISPRAQAAIIAEATAITVVAPAVGAAYDHSKRQSAARIQAAQTIATKP